MAFIGVIAESKNEMQIKKIISKNLNSENKEHTVITINSKSIDNIKNIRFETILVISLEELSKKYSAINEILKNAKYLVINSDIDENNLEFINNTKVNAITFGFNQKATITASSVEDNLMLCIQRKIIDVNRNILEPQEIEIKNNGKKLSNSSHNAMGIASILLIYGKKEKNMDILDEKISSIRKEYSKKLSEHINQELEDLEMKNAKINVKVDYIEKEFFKTGKDIVKFYITTNLGEGEKELSKIASGGEMSRTMLAIKKVLADTDSIPVLVFDEIDTGISGKAANAVAIKLKAIAKKHQVMCISHLPNIAAIADYNYFISKNVKEDRTKTQIKLLEENEVIEEIARISSGEVNTVTLQYAYELRNKKAS